MNQTQMLEYFSFFCFVATDLFTFVAWIRVFDVHACLLPHVCSAYRGQKKVIHSLELEFQPVLDYHVNASQRI